MSAKLRTVVIPAAGRGTRLLPATKATPKELMNVYDRPALQFALDEALELGAERIVVVIHPEKQAIREYLARDRGYIQALRDSGKHKLGQALSRIELPDQVDLVFAEQAEPMGLGHAVLCAQAQVLPGPLAVLLPDDLILGAACLPEMAESYTGGHMIAAMEVEADDTASYGIFRLAGPARGQNVAVAGMVEKPKPAEAPSRLAAVGRYILDDGIFDALRSTGLGSGGEIQLTDAIARDAERMPLTAFRFSGRRYDCGTHDGLLEAAIARQVAVRMGETAPTARPGRNQPSGRSGQAMNGARRPAHDHVSEMTPRGA